MSKSPTTVKYKDGDKLPPIHPGEILRSEFLEPLNLSATKLAQLMQVPATRVTAIVSDSEKRAITADTAYRLACVFKTSPGFWLNLQANYEVEMLEFTGKVAKIRSEVREFATV
jgi:addiction module HigA family antidote